MMSRSEGVTPLSNHYVFMYETDRSRSDGTSPGVAASR